MSMAMVLGNQPAAHGTHQCHLHTSRASQIAELRRACIFHSCSTDRLRGTDARHRGTLLAVAAIGFDLGSRADQGAAPKGLLPLASSLLLHQHVLQSKPSKAFLKVLLALQLQHPQQALSAYGDWYRELASCGSSWQDHLLDEVVAGRNNPLAKAAAQGDAAATAPHLHAAAAQDLDALQRLSITESTLAGWVNEVSDPAPSGWLPAASSLASGARRRPEAEAAQSAASERDGLAAPSSSENIMAPLTAVQRQAWRERIGSAWQWSSALPDLLQLWRERGTGLVSQHSMLDWAGDGLVGQPHAATSHLDRCSNLAGPHEGAAFWSSVEQHVAGSDGGGQNWLLLGRPEAMKVSMALWARLVQDFAPRGLRVVRLRPEHLSSIDELGRAMGQHPRVRWAVVCFPFRLLSPAAEAVIPTLAGSGCWPENAALYAVSDEDEGEINRQKCASGRAVNTLWASAWLRCEEEPFNSNGTA